MIGKILHILAVTVIQFIHLGWDLVKQFEKVGFIARGNALLLQIMIPYPVQVFGRELPLIQGL
jgi:hypothetical protein